MLPSPAWPKQECGAQALAYLADDAKSSGSDLRYDDVWLNFKEAIIFSDSESSRRTRHSSCRSVSSRARSTSVAPAARHPPPREPPLRRSRRPAVDFDQQQRRCALRRERSHAEIAGHSLERIAVDELERRGTTRARMIPVTAATTTRRWRMSPGASSDWEASARVAE